MTDTLSPLLQALDRLDRLPAAPRCLGPDWSTNTQARHLQALYAEHHGHHVPATWAEQMWPLLDKSVAAPTSPMPVLQAKGAPCLAQYSLRTWGLLFAGLALTTFLVMGRGHHPSSVPNPEDSQATGTSDLVPFTADIQGAPSLAQVPFVN